MCCVCVCTSIHVCVSRHICTHVHQGSLFDVCVADCVQEPCDGWRPVRHQSQVVLGAGRL